MLTSDLVCSRASVTTRFFVLGRSLGSYCKHCEARPTTCVASSEENFPSKCESIKRLRFSPLIISRACIYCHKQAKVRTCILIKVQPNCRNSIMLLIQAFYIIYTTQRLNQNSRRNKAREAKRIYKKTKK